MLHVECGIELVLILCVCGALWSLVQLAREALMVINAGWGVRGQTQTQPCQGRGGSSGRNRETVGPNRPRNNVKVAQCRS